MSCVCINSFQSDKNDTDQVQSALRKVGATRIDDLGLLKIALENGMIDLGTIQKQIDMQKRKELLSTHPYAVWEGKNGKWYTYLPDDEKGRALKKRSSQKGIEDLIVNYYEKLQELHTIEDVFDEWINTKLEFGEIQKQTYDRYKTDYVRFFDDECISKRDIGLITTEELETFIKKTIREKKLTNKAYSGFRLIIIGIFKHAKKKKYSDISITQFFGDIDISSKSFSKKIVNDEDSVFTDAEVSRISTYISENPTIVNLGIMLAFQTGLRVGELAALKYSDVKGNILNVNKTEIRYRGPDNKYVFEIRESAKTDAGNREVILSSDALKTISEIKKQNPFGEFMFVKNGQRIKEKAFSVKIVRICKTLQIKERSMHKTRKTYATKLINGKVDERIVIKQLGHTDISCTKNFYYFNNKDIEEAKKQIELAVSY